MSANKWYHNKKAGLVQAEGQEGYVCRGFRKEHGDLLAASQEMYGVLCRVRCAWEGYSTCVAPHAEIRRYYAEFCEAMEDLESVIAKAEGRGAAS